MYYTHFSIVNSIADCSTTILFCVAVHGFLQTEYSVEEGNAVDTVFQLNVKGTTQFNNITINGIITAEPATNTTSKNKTRHVFMYVCFLIHFLCGVYR